MTGEALSCIYRQVDSKAGLRLRAQHKVHEQRVQNYCWKAAAKPASVDAPAAAIGRFLPVTTDRFGSKTGGSQ